MKNKILIIIGIVHYHFAGIAETRNDTLFVEQTFLDDEDAHFGDVLVQDNLSVLNTIKTHDLIVDGNLTVDTTISATGIDVTNLTAANANIDNLTATNADITNLNVDTLNVTGTSLVGCDVFVGCNLYIPETTAPNQGVVFKYSGTTAAHVAIPFIHNAGTGCLFVGENSGNFTGGNSNVGVGPSTLTNIDTSSVNNTAVGWYALNACTIGTNNTAIGNASLYHNTAGIQNTAVGSYALGYNTIGINNTAIGNGALGFNTTGSNNTAVGHNALIDNTTGVDNVALGLNSLFNVVDGQGNIGIGSSAGGGIVSGTGNISIGYNAGNFLSITGSNNILIAHNGTSTDSGVIRIGTSGAQTTNFQAGIYGVTAATMPTSVVSIDSNGQLGTGIITNLTATNISTQNLTATNADITNFTGTNINTTNVTAANANIDNLTATNAAITNLNADTLNVTGTSLVGCDVFVGCNLYIPETTSATQGVIFKYSGTTAAPGAVPFLHNAGTDCLFVGENSGSFTGGTSNIGVGPSTLANIDTAGINNTAVGWFALNVCTTGTDNTAIGNAALFRHSTGLNNTAVGSFALLNSTTAGNNTAIGAHALAACVDGLDNIAIGYFAGNNITEGSNNIFISNQGASTDSGVIRIGTSGAQTTNFQAGIFGVTAATTPTSAVSIDSNGQLGTGIITNNINVTGSSPTEGNMLKDDQLFLHNNGIDCLFVGLNSGSFTGGTSNIGVGPSTLANIDTTGSNNTAVGWFALNACTTGTDNTALGNNTLTVCTTGINNTAVGSNVLNSNITGSNNTAVGCDALFNNTIGFDNVALGFNSLFNVADGQGNIGIGFFAGNGIVSGTDNISIGYNAGSFLSVTGSNNILIAHNGTPTDSGVIRIGTSGAQTTNFQAGIFGVNNLGTMVYINANGQLGTTPSARIYKQNITGISDQTITHFSELNPVQFTYISDETNSLQYGFIAEDVEPLLPPLIMYDADENIFTIRYQLMYALLHQWLKNVDNTTQQQALVLAQLQISLTAILNRLNIDEGLITQLRTDLTAAQNLITTQGNLITGLRTDLTTAQGLITTQGNLITGLRTNLTTAQTTINSLITRVTVLEGLVSTLQGLVGGL